MQLACVSSSGRVPQLCSQLQPVLRLQGVAKGTLTVGDAVLFIAMVQQLSAPLNYFGSFYRQIQTYMIDCVRTQLSQSQAIAAFSALPDLDGG